jgi:hypothetical protein
MQHTAESGFSDQGPPSAACGACLRFAAGRAGYVTPCVSGSVVIAPVEKPGSACADVSGAGPSPAAELRSAYSFGIIALAARRTPRFRLRAPTRVMAVGRDDEAGRRTRISSPTPMVPGLLTVA